MLRREQAIITYAQGQAIPDRLCRERHRHYLPYVDRMLMVYRSGVGQTRHALHRAVANILAREPECDRRRVCAFCKLLDDRAQFASDPDGAAASLRLRVFTLAARYHPLVASPSTDGLWTERGAKARLAEELAQSWVRIDAALYADVFDRQNLLSFEGYDSGEALLARYNVAQVQCCLYGALHATVTAGRDFKTILRYAKLARLMHDIRRVGTDRYRFELTGPASVLHQTRRYGVSFARFVPALIACGEWQLDASIRTPSGGSARLQVSSDDGLTSHLPPPNEFDSTVEESFARAFGAERDGWTLTREAVVLHDGQSTFVPDFALRHGDGREVLLEIVGFWTPSYLEQKRRTLLRFAGQPIIVAVCQRLAKHPTRNEGNLIFFKSRLNPQDVMKALRSFEKDWATPDQAM